MNINGIDLPTEIVTSLSKLTKDINIDDYSEKGSNGYVFFGYHKIFKKRVSIKFYYSGENFHQEVQLLKNINNEYIIKVWDARTISNGWSYFITAEIKKGDLDDFINKDEFSLNKAIKITQKILNGVSCMHSNPYNLLHRDLKPQNILLNEKNNPKIADFGSVKRLPENNSYVNGSKHAALYRPPETFYDSKYYYCSDVYQIGMVLYQLLGGNLSYNPVDLLSKRKLKKYKKLEDDYERTSFVDSYIADRAKKEKLLDLNSLPLYCSDKIKRIIRKSTRFDIKKRFKSCYEFLHAIHKLGTIPEWEVNKNNRYILNDWNGKDYRIVEKNSNYICEKNINSGWRKDGKIKKGSIESVIDQINNNINWN